MVFRSPVERDVGALRIDSIGPRARCPAARRRACSSTSRRGCCSICTSVSHRGQLDRRAVGDVRVRRRDECPDTAGDVADVELRRGVAESSTAATCATRRPRPPLASSVTCSRAGTFRSAACALRALARDRTMLATTRLPVALDAASFVSFASRCASASSYPFELDAQLGLDVRRVFAGNGQLAGRASSTRSSLTAASTACGAVVVDFGGRAIAAHVRAGCFRAADRREKLCSPGAGGGAVTWYTTAPTITNATMSSNSRFPIDLELTL